MFRAKQFNREIGEIGELVARKYLEKRGFLILGQNITRKWGEIDLIALENNSLMIFIEVKTLLIDKKYKFQGGVFKPEDNMTKRKLKNLSRASQFLANDCALKLGRDLDWRIDLICVFIFVDYITNKKSYFVKHYKNIY